MLGRLEMNVDDCIHDYIELMQDVFGSKAHRLPISLGGKVRARFDSKKLQSAIEKVAVRRGAKGADLFNDGVERGCRV